jgi:hypothetical protein
MNIRIFIIVLSIFGFFINVNAQGVGINLDGDAPHSEAALDIDFTNKGLLLPRVALTSKTSPAPLNAHVNGMMVYNTSTAGSGVSAVVPGTYYNNGSAWVYMGADQIPTLYNSNGTLNSTRIVDQSTFNLSYTGTGNLGIGTTNPLFKLHLASSAFGFAIDRHNSGPGNQSIIALRKNLSDNPDVFTPLTVGSNIGSISFSGVNGGVTAFGPYVPLGGATRIVSRAEETFTPTSASSNLGFFTTPVGSVGAAERLTILGNGNIGVNDGAPTERLAINGNVRFSGALMPANNAGLSGQVLTSAGAGLPPNWTNPLSSNIYIADGTLTNNRNVNLSSFNLSFSGSGNVGIGTTAPSRKLEINSGLPGTPHLRFTNMRANQTATHTSGSAHLMVVDNNGDVRSKIYMKEYSPSSCACTGAFPYTLPSDLSFFGQYDGNWNGNGIGNTTNADFILPSPANAIAAGHKYGDIVIIHRSSGYNVVIGTTNTNLTVNFSMSPGSSVGFALAPDRWYRVF